MAARHIAFFSAAAFAFFAQAVRAQQPVASVATDGVQLKNVLSVANGKASIANNGEITAIGKTADVTLARGGSLLVCTSTTLHIAQDKATDTAGADEGLMFSLDRGAFETDYKPATYSDVVLTPDLRLILSGPGMARLKMRVNEQGDTCIDNSGADAPYVVVSSLMDGGVYRVQPGQRVLFVGGSINQVVDNEREPCGCPAAAEPVPNAVAAGGQPSGVAPSGAAENPFPTAVSEGLAPPAPLPSTPAVPEGTPHAQVQVTLSSTTPPGPPPPSVSAPQPSASTPPVQTTTPSPKRSFFGRIGHFFARVFGAE